MYFLFCLHLSIPHFAHHILRCMLHYKIEQQQKQQQQQQHKRGRERESEKATTKSFTLSRQNCLQISLIYVIYLVSYRFCSGDNIFSAASAIEGRRRGGGGGGEGAGLSLRHGYGKRV